MARPRKKIDKKEFESLLVIQCSLAEVTAYFDHKLDGCSEDTIERWCKRTYKKSFADVAAQKRECGKISIRRAQFRMMEKNPTALIWASKQYLGQSDKVEQTVAVISDETREQVSRLLDGLDEGDSCPDS